MKRLRTALLSSYVLGLIAPSLSMAQASECRPTSAKEVLGCVLKNHPELRRGYLERVQVEQLEAVAGQVPNPELGTRLGLASLTEGASKTTELTLLQPLELGGKRRNRIIRAQSQVAAQDAALRRAQEEITTRTLLSLHRLRQIQEEMGFLSETVHTFERQIELHKARPSLTPEQEVSVSIFALAKEDSENKRALLETERMAHIQSIRFGTGVETKYSQKWLPLEPTQWPELPESSGSGRAVSFLKAADANLELARAELSLSQSEVWPDLSVGPIFEADADGVESQWSLGLILSFQLPILNRNSGGRAYAQRGLALADESVKIESQRVFSELAAAAERYREAVSQLRKSRWHQEIESRHKKIESLFQRGVLPSPLVVEAHRQVLEVQKSSHELELDALEAYYRFSILSGIMPEGSL